MPPEVIDYSDCEEMDTSSWILNRFEGKFDRIQTDNLSMGHKGNRIRRWDSEEI